MARNFTAAVVFALAALCGEGTAFAQPEPPPAQYPAVFRGAVVDTRAHETLNVSLDLVEAYDNNLTAEAGGFSPSSPLQISGFFTSFVPEIDFESKGDRIQFSTVGASSLRYYSDIQKVYAMNHSVGAAMSAQITGSTNFSLSQTASYAPAFLYALFAPRMGGSAPVDLVPAGADYQATSERSYSYVTNASVSHAFTPRASLSLNGDLRHTNFVGSVAGYSDLTSSDAGASWSYSVDRNVKLRLGYTFRHTQISSSLKPVEHDVEIGVDYTRPLSRTRKSLIGFSVGPTLLSGSLVANDPTPTSMHYAVTGNAFYETHLTRTWHARADYRRGLSYIEGFSAPVYNHSASVGANGFLSPRVDLSLSAAFALGDMAAEGAAANFTTYTGDMRLRVGLTRSWAAYVEGLLYEYTFDRALLLAPDVPNHLNRNAVRVGLTLWLPLMRSR